MQRKCSVRKVYNKAHQVYKQRLLLKVTSAKKTIFYDKVALDV